MRPDPRINCNNCVYNIESLCGFNDVECPDICPTIQENYELLLEMQTEISMKIEEMKGIQNEN